MSMMRELLMARQKMDNENIPPLAKSLLERMREDKPLLFSSLMHWYSPIFQELTNEDFGTDKWYLYDLSGHKNHITLYNFDGTTTNGISTDGRIVADGINANAESVESVTVDLQSYTIYFDVNFGASRGTAGHCKLYFGKIYLRVNNRYTSNGGERIDYCPRSYDVFLTPYKYISSYGERAFTSIGDGENTSKIYLWGSPAIATSKITGSQNTYWGSFAIFDRVLDEDEMSWVKNNMVTLA